MDPLTPEELRELRRLHVSLGRKADALFAGDYRSAVRGQGMEFEEVRQYNPGDDIRHIDWNVTARTNEPFVKVYKEERQVTVLLMVDLSASTHTGSGGRDGRTDRRLQLARVAGGLAFASIRNQDRIGLLTFTDRVEQWVAPRKHRGHAWSIIRHAYGARGAHRGTDIGEALAYLTRVQRRRCVVVLVSDFQDDKPWDRALGSVAKRHKLHCVVVQDPLDAGRWPLGLIEVEDAETGKRVLVDGRRLAVKQDASATVKRVERLGARAVALSTTEDPFAVLHGHFQREAMRR